MREARIKHQWLIEFPPGASSDLIEFCLKRELVNRGFDLNAPIERYEDVRNLDYVFLQEE